MLGRLVDVSTEDKVKLHGFLSSASEGTSAVWIIVHGVNGNFYGSTLLRDLATAVCEYGHDALLVNTRGHDLATFGSSDQPQRMGSMFETIDDAQLDLEAWLRFCKDLGYTNVGCIAHSLGAVKVTYALANQATGGLSHLIALSPPRLNTQLLLGDPVKREVFDQHLQEAKQWCDKGFGHHIMRVRFPLANLLSAETFLDKYGSGDKYDYFAYWSKIQTPTYWVFGQQEVREGSVNFRDVDRYLTQAFETQGARAHELTVIDHADHSYRACRRELTRSILTWIGSVSGHPLKSGYNP
ncbi:MAG: alpha/beta hydrolase [Planctomycetota bacterium]|jgi:pimeloyl-ACP methyl ester carboxylesterase